MVTKATKANATQVSKRRTRSHMMLRNKAPKSPGEWLERPQHLRSPRFLASTVTASGTASSQKPVRRTSKASDEAQPKRAGRKASNMAKKESILEKETSEGFAVAAAKSAIHRRYLGVVKNQLQKIRFDQMMLDTYEREGWRSANLERMRPEKELEKSKERIREAKIRIREALEELMTGEAARKEKRVKLDADGQVDASNVCCALCDSNESTDENDIILCDLEGCNRGFHMLCCDPPVTQAELDESDDWFCRRCMTMMDCVNEVSDTVGIDFDSWTDVFREDAQGTEEAASTDGDPCIKRSRRKRIIKPPSKKAASAWDTHSFASDTDDDDFEENQSNDVNKTESEASESGSETDSGSEMGSECDSTSENGISRTEGDALIKGRTKKGREDNVDHGTILTYKRARRKIDYCALAKEMFGNEEEVDDDKDFEEGNEDQVDLGASLKELL